MRKHKILLTVSSLLMAVVLMAGLVFTFATAKPSPVNAQPANITYNIYATDGWWVMADGIQVYSYGFIGGRSTEPVNYLLGQNPLGAPAGTLVGGLVSAAQTWPAPATGAATGLELQLLGNAQFPGPLIWANVGQTVTINFKNLGVFNKKAPNDPHTIHLHAIDVDAANDGVPETSVAAVPANLLSPGAGNVITYTFTASRAGTYMYHCHQEADIHVTMGMWGALVIYEGAPSATNNVPGKPGTLWGQSYARDYVMLLTDTDIRQHASEQLGQQRGRVFNPVNYLPQYWFINGLSFPNTIHAAAGAAAPFNWTQWITAHPGMDPFIVGRQGEKVLVRMINLGFQTQPMHVHGFHPTVLGSDQRQWTWTGNNLEKNTITIGSGETYELLFDMNDQGVTSTYPTTTQSRYNPAGVPPNVPVANNAGVAPAFPPIPDPLAVGLSYVGGPTVSGLLRSGAGAAVETTVGLPTGVKTDSSQFFPFHNHDDYKATNNGVYPGGMFTFVVVIPAATTYP